MSKILIDGYEVPLECMSPDMSRIPEFVTIQPKIAEFMHENGMCGKPIAEILRAFKNSK